MRTLLNRLREVGMSDMIGLTWSMGWLASILAAGFFFSSADNNNYEFLNGLLPQMIWGMAFLIHGSVHLYVCFVPHNFQVRAANSIFGVWIWSYVFMSFVIFDKTPPQSTEWLLAMPIVVDIWLFLNAIVKRRGLIELSKRKQDLMSVIQTLTEHVGVLNESLSQLCGENDRIKTELVQLSGEVNRIKAHINTAKVEG